MFRVVLDSNVFISALCFTKNSPPASIYTLALRGEFELWTSTAILLEIADKLQNKFDWKSSQVERVIKQIARHSTLSEPNQTLNVITADPSDNRILECATAADAHFIVSGDKHLLNLKKFRDITITSPIAFVAIFKA